MAKKATSSVDTFADRPCFFTDTVAFNIFSKSGGLHLTFYFWFFALDVLVLLN